MKIEMKSEYLTPKADILQLHSEGVLCQSGTVTTDKYYFVEGLDDEDF